MNKWVSTECKRLWKRVREIAPKAPLFGHMLKCSSQDYYNAGVEYFITLVWSTTPFWLGAIGLYALKSSGNTPLIDVFTGTFRNGELLVFTISTLTPITYMTLYEDPSGRFPHRLGIGTIAIVLIVCCAGLFSLQKVGVATKTDLIYLGSLWFAGISIVCRYIAVVYNKAKVPTTSELDLTTPASDFASEFNQVADESEASAKTADEFSKEFDATVDANAINEE